MQQSRKSSVTTHTDRQNNDRARTCALLYAILGADVNMQLLSVNNYLSKLQSLSFITFRIRMYNHVIEQTFCRCKHTLFSKDIHCGTMMEANYYYHNDRGQYYYGMMIEPDYGTR